LSTPLFGRVLLQTPSPLRTLSVRFWRAEVLGVLGCFGFVDANDTGSESVQ